MSPLFVCGIMQTEPVRLGQQDASADKKENNKKATTRLNLKLEAFKTDDLLTMKKKPYRSVAPYVLYKLF